MTYQEDPIIDREADDEVEVKDEDPYCDNDYWKETMQFFGDLPHEKEMAEAMQEFQETITEDEIVSICCGAETDDFGICPDCKENT